MTFLSWSQGLGYAGLSQDAPWSPSSITPRRCLTAFDDRRRPRWSRTTCVVRRCSPVKGCGQCRKSKTWSTTKKKIRSIARNTRRNDVGPPAKKEQALVSKASKYSPPVIDDGFGVQLSRPSDEILLRHFSLLSSLRKGLARSVSTGGWMTAGLCLLALTVTGTACSSSASSAASLPDPAITAHAAQASTTQPTSGSAVVTLPLTSVPELPPPTPEAASASTAFLANEGHALILLRAIAGELLESNSPDCDSARTQLSTGPSPGDLASLAAALPDTVLATSYTNLVTGTDEFITRCLTDDGLADSAERLRQAYSLVITREAELA